MATTVYNVQPAVIDIIATKGDQIGLSFQVLLNAAAYDMAGKQVDVTVKRKDGKVMASWSTAGSAPAITLSQAVMVSPAVYDVYTIDAVGINEIGTFKYDVQVTSGTAPITIQKGSFAVTEEITT